jgi:hypothetical protein
MSTTPRTDAARLTEPYLVRELSFEVVRAEVMEELETELIKCREALDKLHIACETSKPEIYEWYLTDPFASEARENAIETLNQTK